MNTVVWIVQILLAFAFLGVGFMKVSQPIDKLAARMGWVKDFSPSFVRLIGALEILGAIGLILPALTGILPWLTPVAALGLALIMIGAVFTHMRLGEFAKMMPSVVLLLLALFVIYGRFVTVPL